ncbi:MAG: ribosomal RNA small subunit methyltransferase A [Nitrososphaerota archaeon]
MSSSARQRVLLSQNFLRDPRLVTTLLDRFRLGSDSIVYEIGPGEGVITEQLALRYKHVVAIEKDRHLAQRLLRRFGDWPNVTIHCGDFLGYRLPHSPYTVFANIPFNITAAIVTRLTGAECPPSVAYLTMQKEAAGMFAGQPRDSLRSILLKPWFELEIVHRFQRSDFMPAPRVDVVMLRLRKRGPPLVSNAERQYFRDFVVHTFTHWQPTSDHPLKDLFTRQQLAHIRRELGFECCIAPTDLTIEHWLSLFGQLKKVNNGHARQVISGSERCLRRQQRRLQKLHRTRASSR